jgi:flagellin-like protein
MEHRRRKGVTPVVAVVLLVFITVVAAGGSFVFMQEVRRDFIQNLGQRYQVEASLDRLECGADHVNATITNTGEKELSVDPVNMWIIEKGSGTQNLSLSRTTFNLGANSSPTGSATKPDSTGTYHTNTKGKTRFKSSQDDYVIEYEFIENQEYVVRGRCTPP